MPIDEQTIAELRALTSAVEQSKTGLGLSGIALVDLGRFAFIHRAALLAAASNEALMTAERDFWRSETQRETEKSQGLQREVESLRAVAREYLEASEAPFDWMNGNDSVADYADAFPDDFKRLGIAMQALRADLTPPAASEEDAS